MKARRPRRHIHGVLLLDKPLGISSNTVLLEVRRLFMADKAGHTGTLDPLATGLLPICLGQTTKLTAQLLDAHKRYRADIRFGSQTSTGDAEGEVVASAPIGVIDGAEIEKSLAAFIGTVVQVPPMHSAIKQQGVRLYELAREGVEVERKPREVQITALSLIELRADGVILDISCSKGTYVRTFAEDWARSVGQLAHLRGLRRLAVGPFAPAQMVTIEQLHAARDASLNQLDALLLPSISTIEGWRKVEITPAEAVEFEHGRSVPSGQIMGDIALVCGNKLMGLAEVAADGRMQPRRWFGLEGI